MKSSTNEDRNAVLALRAAAIQYITNHKLPMNDDIFMAIIDTDDATILAECETYYNEIQTNLHSGLVGYREQLLNALSGVAAN